MGSLGGQDGINGLGGNGGDGGTTSYTGLTLPTTSQFGGNGGAGGTGATGSNPLYGGGGGGGAGGYGAVITGPINDVLTVDITGGWGGNGGRGGDGVAGPGFGGGGGGGVGLSVDNSVLSIGSIVSGGNGGAGGAVGSGVSAIGAIGGAGGAGGDGLVATNSNITVLGTVMGGLGGVGSDGGAIGAGGTGIVAQNSDIFITGAGVVSAGVDGAGHLTGLALDLSGDYNSLYMFPGGLLTGGVRTSAALAIVTPLGDVTLSNVISGSGSVLVMGESTLTLTGVNTYTGGTTVFHGTLAISDDSNLGDATGGLTLDGGALKIDAAVTSNRAVTLDVGGGVIDTNGQSMSLGGGVSGAGAFTKTGAGTLTLAGASSYSGSTFVDQGVLRAGAANAFSATSAHIVASGATLDLNGHDQTIGSLSGLGSVTLGSATLTTGGDNSSTTFGGVISGTGGLTKTGSGNLTLFNAGDYTGPTTILGGTLSVNTSLAGDVIIAGGALGGNGSVRSVTIGSGGALAPGNSIGTLNVNGNLAFGPGSYYRVEVSPTAADRANVAGSANLSGATVQTIFAPGAYPSRSYTILSAAGGLAGTTFAGLTASGAPSGFITSLSYTPTDVMLNLIAALGRNDLLTLNQRSAVTAVNAIFNAGGVVPGGFGLFYLSGRRWRPRSIRSPARRTPPRRPRCRKRAPMCAAPSSAACARPAAPPAPTGR